MPSPIGHALAGVAIAWMMEKREAPQRSATPGRSVTPEHTTTPERSKTPERSVTPEQSRTPDGVKTPKRSRTPELELGPTGGPTRSRPTIGTLAIVCAVLAVLPDIDLLYRPIHRTATHSVTAAILVTIVAAAVTRWVTGRVSWRIAIACGASYGSHILLDWLGADASVPFGIQALWPFSDRWFMSPWALFPGTERRDVFSARSILINLRALGAELIILGPVAWASWVRRTRRIRGRIFVPGDRLPPSA